MRNWCICGDIYLVLCHKGHRFCLPLLLGLLCTRGRTSVAAVAVLPWPFLVIFLLNLFQFSLFFFLGGSEVIYGNGINLGYDGKMEGFQVHLIFILFGCRENVGKGEKVRILFFSFVFILLWYW